MEIIEKNRIDLTGIEKRLLHARHLLLLETGNNKYVALRILRQHLSFISYNFVKDEPSFLPLAPVGSSGSTGVTQPFFSSTNTLGINQLSVSDLLSIGSNRTNNLMQVFYGIAPSYVYTSMDEPNSLDTLPTAGLSPSSTYPYLYGHSGFDSPYYRPSEHTEFFAIANVSVTFTLINTVSIPVSPKMLLVLNNCTVEPVHDYALIKKMVDGTTAREIATVGQVYSEVTWTSERYGNISPFTASDANFPDKLKEAGY